MEKQNLNRYIQLTSHPKIAFLRGEAIAMPETRVYILDIAKELSQQGYQRLLALHIDQRNADIIELLESLGFRRRQEMQLYEASLHEGKLTMPEIPPEIVVTDFHGVTAEKLYPAAVEAFSQRPIVGNQQDLKEIITDASFLTDCSFAAWFQDDIVGFQMVRCESKEVAYFAYLGVVPGWRRRKIGIALASHSLAACQELGSRKATAKVASDNTEIVGLLRQIHFTRVSSEFNFSLSLEKLGE